MNKIFLICDESGAKGFSDNNEDFDGEFGIMAGYFLDNSNKDKLSKEFEVIYNKYKTDTSKKFHITDLKPNEQEKLRNDIFDCFNTNKIEFIYEAISVQGYNDSYKAMREIQKNQSCEERLHSELFIGLFGKAIAYFVEKYGENDIEIEVITDTIDQTIKKEFEKQIKDLISPSYAKNFKTYDKSTKELKEYTLTVKSEWLENNTIDANYNISVADNELTFIADVLVNSLHYFIKEEIKSNPNLMLNSKDAIKKYPIDSLAYCLSTQQNPNMFDSIFGRGNCK